MSSLHGASHLLPDPPDWIKLDPHRRRIGLFQTLLRGFDGQVAVALPVDPLLIDRP
jgi:hypothetical protein